MKNYYLFLLLVLTISTVSCQEYDPYYVEHSTVVSKTNESAEKLVALFQKGFSMKLENAYVVKNLNTADYVPEHKRATFYKNGIDVFTNQTTYVVSEYSLTEDHSKLALPAIQKGDVWRISPVNIHKDTTYRVLGTGNDGVARTIRTIEWNTISTTALGANAMTIMFKNGLETQYSWTEICGRAEVLTTNLKLHFFDFDGKTLRVITNSKYNITQAYSAPLSSAEATKIITNGVEGVDYEITMFNRTTVYKIDENYYIPRYGSGYIFYASSSANGFFSFFSQMNYVFEFKVI